MNLSKLSRCLLFLLYNNEFEQKGKTQDMRGWLSQIHWERDHIFSPIRNNSQ